MDTIGNAIDRLDPDGMAEFWKGYWKGHEELKMEEQEVWSEIQEITKQLNHYMRLAVSKGLRVEAVVDNNMFEINYKHCIPRVEVAVYKEMHNPRHIHV